MQIAPLSQHLLAPLSVRLPVAPPLPLPWPPFGWPPPPPPALPVGGLDALGAAGCDTADPGCGDVETGCDDETGEGCGEAATGCDPETGEGCGEAATGCDPETGEGCAERRSPIDEDAPGSRGPGGPARFDPAVDGWPEDQVGGGQGAACPDDAAGLLVAQNSTCARAVALAGLFGGCAAPRATLAVGDAFILTEGDSNDSKVSIKSLRNDSQLQCRMKVSPWARRRWRRWRK